MRSGQLQFTADGKTKQKTSLITARLFGDLAAAQPKALIALNFGLII